MAIRVWQDVDGNWNNVANWTGAAVPVGGDTAKILEGSQNIQTNIDQSAVNNLVTDMGRDFSGKLGTAAAPFKTGTGSSLHFNGRKIQQFAYQPSSATKIEVEATSGYPHAFYLNPTGVVTELNIGIGKGITIAGGSYTTIRVVGGARSAIDLQIHIDTAVTAITTLIASGGRITCEKSIATLRIIGACDFNLNADGAGVSTLLELLHPAAKFRWNADGSTIVKLVCAGNFDCSEKDVQRILTNGDLWRGGTIVAPNTPSGITWTNPVKVYGGSWQGDVSTTMEMVGGISL